MTVDRERYRQAERRFWQATGTPAPADRFVELPRIGTRVRVQGVGTGADALFLHGGPNAGSTWAPLVTELEGLRCWIVDRPGTGLSDPYPLTADTLPGFGARLVGDLLDALELEASHVVASSFGGYLALHSAAAEPDRIRRMVQMAAPALVPGQRIPPFMKGLRFGIVRWLTGLLPPSRRMNRKVMREIGHGATLDGQGFPPGFEQWYLDLARYTDTMQNDGEMIGTVLLPNGDELRLTAELLGSVHVPTLFLWGEDDGFGGPDNARRVTSMIPGAELRLLSDAGHLPWLDDPAGIARQTATFLMGDG